MTTKPYQIVFVIDDDASMRDAISRLLSAVGLRVQRFRQARSFFVSNYLMCRVASFLMCDCLDSVAWTYSGKWLTEISIYPSSLSPGTVTFHVRTGNEGGAIEFSHQALSRTGIARRDCSGKLSITRCVRSKRGFCSNASDMIL